MGKKPTPWNVHPPIHYLNCLTLNRAVWGCWSLCPLGEKQKNTLNRLPVIDRGNTNVHLGQFHISNMPEVHIIGLWKKPEKPEWGTYRHHPEGDPQLGIELGVCMPSPNTHTPEL